MKKSEIEEVDFAQELARSVLEDKGCKALLSRGLVLNSRVRKVRHYLLIRAAAKALMALYRSKLGPVGGGNENGISEGGVVVDLDPLSAFALMDGGAAEDLGTTTNSGGASSNNAGTKPVPLSGDTVTPVGKDHEPALGRRDSRGAESKMSDLGRWRVSDLGGAVQSQQVRCPVFCYARLLSRCVFHVPYYIHV